MKILFISNSYYPNIGGVESVLLNLTKQLSINSIQPIVVTTRWPKSLPYSTSHSNVLIYRLPFRFPSINPLRIPGFIFRFIQSNYLLFKIIKYHKPDIINVHYITENCLYALIASLLFKIPLVSSFHGSDILEFSKRSTLHKYIYSLIVNHSSHLTFNSTFLKHHLINTIPKCSTKNSSVLPNGINLPDDSLETKPNFLSIPFILGVGRLEHFKGFDLLIEAFHIIQNKYPNSNLIIIGDGPELNKLKLLTKQLEISNKVSFLGLLNSTTISLYYKLCEFVVVPSRREAFGIVILEAYSHSKPVIGFNVGGIPEILTNERGILIKDLNKDSLAKSITKLLGDRKHTDILGKNAYNYVKDLYLWPNIINKYISIYKSLS